MTHSKLTLCSLVALFAVGQAFAHTGVRSAALEDTDSYNGFTVTHGCGAHGGDAYPVIGQSAVFPNGSTAVWRNAAGKVIPVSYDPKTGAVINNGNNTIGTTGGGHSGPVTGNLALQVAGYAGFSSAFTTTQEIVDDLGNVHGLHWKDGAMEPKLNTITPFKVHVPPIVNNCVKSLQVRIGVINWCDKGKNEENDAEGPYEAPKDAFGHEVPMIADLENAGGVQQNVASIFFTDILEGNDDDNRADWWFTAPVGGSKLYNDPDLLQPDYWTTLTVNNSAADVRKCKGEPFDVSVEPSGVDFDTYLNGPNTQPFTEGDTDF